MNTPYENHATQNHPITKHSPDGMSIIEECSTCGARFLFHHTEPAVPRQLDPLPPVESYVNGYKIKRNSFWNAWQVSHPEIGSCGELTFYRDAVNYCKAG